MADLDLDRVSIVVLIAALGAINWGTRELFDYNFVTKMLGTGNAGLVYIAIGVAGLAVVLHKVDVMDLEEI